MPALLLEIGFITNIGDAALMAENPNLIAQGIYNGILRYYGLG
jgi:N-acetylmuramoyl-L-alanine amidase